MAKHPDLFTFNFEQFKMTILKLFTLIYILFKRVWLSLLIFFSVFFLAVIYGSKSEPLSFNYSDFVILDQQIRRSKSLRNVDVLITGDSSGISAIDPILLEKQFKKEFQVLSTMAFLGPLGQIKLIENYLKSNPPLETLVIIWAPALDQNIPWEKYAFQEMWPTRNIYQVGRAVLRGKVFGEILSPPIEPFLINRTNLINLINKQQGTLTSPTSLAPANNPKLNKPHDYAISRPNEASLRKAKVMLRELPIEKIYLAILPLPDIYHNPALEAPRKQFILKLQKILGLPKEALLEMPFSLPYELYSNKNHFNDKGRTVYTQIFRKSLLKAICKSNRKTSQECTNIL